MIEPVPAKYNGVAMILHWLTALLMIFMIFFGEDLMGGEGGGGEGGRATGTFLPSIHVSIGVTILMLTLLRLIWRMKNPPPPYPTTMKPWEVTVSKITHALFYVLMIGLPLTGWLAFASFLKESPAMANVAMFGLFPVPGTPITVRLRAEPCDRQQSWHGAGDPACACGAEASVHRWRHHLPPHAAILESLNCRLRRHGLWSRPTLNVGDDNGRQNTWI